MNTDKDDVRNILLADVPWIDQRDVILAMLSAAHAKGREDGLWEAMDSIVDIAEPTLDEYEPKQLFSAGIRASISEIERLLDKKP